MRVQIFHIHVRNRSVIRKERSGDDNNGFDGEAGSLVGRKRPIS